MRRVAGVLVFTLLAAGLGGSTRENVAGAQTPPKATAVLALAAADDGSTKLAWLEPATLRPLAQRSLVLPGSLRGAVLSPGGRYVALGGPGSTGVRVIDVRRMKVVARVALRPSHRRLTPLAWPERHRLLVLDSPQDAHGAPDALLGIDPFARRIVGRTVRASSAKEWTTWAQAGRELIVLSRPAEGVGVVRLVVFGPGGGILRARDVGIVAGLAPHGSDGSSVPRARLVSPALAVDPVGRRAFVVDTQTVAQVDLATLDIAYARVTESRPLAVRMLAWLEPAAHAKVIGGFSRSATWLGDDLLAVAGSTYDRARSTPSGLQLVDVETGATRTLEPRAAAHRFSQGILLAFGAGRDSSSNVSTGMGVSAFTQDGVRLWSSLGDTPVERIEAAGGYAYVPTPEEVFPTGVRVIDLATGSVLRTIRGELPTFLTRG